MNINDWLKSEIKKAALEIGDDLSKEAVEQILYDAGPVFLEAATNAIDAYLSVCQCESCIESEAN